MKTQADQTNAAFPYVSICQDGTPFVNAGMTYRQWLIGMCLQGLLANHANSILSVEDAFDAADGAIARLERERADKPV
jgi:hypothetical protein